MFFSLMYDETTLDGLCYAYRERYIKALTESEDGYLLLEQSELNIHRSNWIERRIKVTTISNKLFKIGTIHFLSKK